MSVRSETWGNARPRLLARAADYAELTKPRITALVVSTTCVGLVLGTRGPVDLMLALHTLLGTALVCAGTGTLNQVWERERDARMPRTALRPLPQGRLSAAEALLFGVLLSVTGLLELALFANVPAALVAAVTLAGYLFVYTPLKTRTWLCTMVGAVPGALPPVIGWAATRGSLDPGAGALFGILFVWQLPHFYSISWMYRHDYARGGYPMLAVLDTDGSRTAAHILAWSAVLLPASLLPTLLGLTGSLYAAGAVGLGVVFLALGAGLAKRCDGKRARRLFLWSILYLPAILVLLVLDRVPRA